MGLSSIQGKVLKFLVPLVILGVVVFAGFNPALRPKIPENLQPA
jgi:hypothetical protein